MGGTTDYSNEAVDMEEVLGNCETCGVTLKRRDDWLINLAHPGLWFCDNDKCSPDEAPND